MINNLKENWVTGSNLNESKYAAEDGCLFMLNFSNSGTLMAATTGIYYKIH